MWSNRMFAGWAIIIQCIIGLSCGIRAVYYEHPFHWGYYMVYLGLIISVTFTVISQRNAK